MVAEEWIGVTAGRWNIVLVVAAIFIVIKIVLAPVNRSARATIDRTHAAILIIEVKVIIIV